jgi:hypothetical protein
MKKIVIVIALLFSVTIMKGQNSPSLLIDNVSTQFSSVSLPYWLKSGQTINIGTNAKSISILEFNVNGTLLEFSQALSITSFQTVPANKVWKMEGIGLIDNSTTLPAFSMSTGSSSTNTSQLPTLYQSPRTYSTSGTYNFKVPPGITSICVEVWGAGGAGYYTTNIGSGGGGGGYGYQCLSVVSGANYILTIGAGGVLSGSGNTVVASNGGNTTFGSVILANGGTGGNATSFGVGGTCNANWNITGNNGSLVNPNLTNPLGGGSANGNNSSGGGGTYAGQGAGVGNGSDGQIKIYW